MMVKRTLPIFICILLIFSLIGFVGAADGRENIIDNSDVMPKYLSDEYIKLEKSYEDSEELTPSWLKTAIIVETKLENASPDGTLEGGLSVLDHYSEMGVNCLYIDPVSDPATAALNGYTNKGIHTIRGSLTGTSDYDEGWERFGWYVRQAHKRNIRILLDVIVWGVGTDSPIVTEHPEYFTHNDDGSIVMDKWGGPQFDVNSEAWQKWYKSCLMNILEVTDIDGFRVDLDPGRTGYTFWEEVKKEAREKLNKKIAVMSENQNERLNAYDFEQFGVMDWKDWDYAKQNEAASHDYFLDFYNIVDAVKTGQGVGSQLSQALSTSGMYRFYTLQLSGHDYHNSIFRNNLLRVGYQAIFSPFIPEWMSGEETNMILKNQLLYFNADLDYSRLNDPETRQFYETLKKYIRIRRTYTDIFEYFPESLRESNICKVDVAGLEKYQAYARYDTKGNAILIVPQGNVNQPDGTMSVSVPFEKMGMANALECTVTDLMNNKKITSGKIKNSGVFDVKVKSGEIGVYLVSVTKKKSKIEKTNVESSGEVITQSSQNVETIENITENPVKNNKTINKTMTTTESDYLGNTFWIVTGCLIAAVVIGGVLLTLYLIIVRKKGRLNK